ncbi:MAG: glutamine synthetase type III, partial [Oscillospiraceae bacterium]
YKQHSRVIFIGNNYTEQWIELAKERGLPNLSNTVDAASAMIAENNVEMLNHYNILTKVECVSRYEIMLENYTKIITIEANTMLEMTKRQILPAVIKFSGDTAKSYTRLIEAGCLNENLQAMVSKLSKNISDISKTCDILEKAVADLQTISGTYDLAVSCRDNVKTAMEQLRLCADAAEVIVSSEAWPMPNYTDLLHRV